MRAVTDTLDRLSHHQEQRLHRAIALLDTCMEQPLPLARFARAAALSPYHFHRLFRQRYGETLARYVTRRRVERAATKLAIDHDAGLLEVALSVGFGSAEAFSRAFKNHFGHAPSRWRKRCTEWQVPRRAGRIVARVETLAAVHVAYMRYEGPFGPPSHRFWPECVVPWIRSARLGGAPRFGIARDDPHVTQPRRCRYDAAVAVPRNYVPPDGVHLGEIAGGLHAVVPFTGPPAMLPDAWRTLVAHLGSSTRYELDSRPPFEKYASGYRPPPDRDWLECELCVPLRRRYARKYRLK